MMVLLSLDFGLVDGAGVPLVDKGISEDRIIAVGMGESQVLNHCQNGIKCSEEEHAVNRRTVFEIVNN